MREFFLNSLAVSLQENLGLSPLLKGSIYCYSVLAHYMYYACKPEESKSEVLFECLPSYGLSEHLRREIISDEMHRFHLKDAPKYIAKSITEAVLLMCTKSEEGDDL